MDHWFPDPKPTRRGTSADAAPGREAGGAVGTVHLLLLALLAAGFVVVFILSQYRRCVLEGTLVDTPHGPVPIERLQIGDAVWTRARDGGVRRGFVVAVRSGRAVLHRTLRFEDGRTLGVTGTHPIATVAGPFVAAANLTPGAEIASRVGPVRLAGVDAGLGWVRVYDISVEPGESFFADGILVHNKRVISNPSVAFEDTRTVISGQAAYQSANHGYYDGRLECLAAPSLCIPGYSENAPTFLDEVLASQAPKSGYQREFIPGRPAVAPLNADISPSSVESYAYVAVPTVPGQTGGRGFCGDASGEICFTPDGERPLVRDGRCVVTGIEEPWGGLGRRPCVMTPGGDGH